MILLSDAPKMTLNDHENFNIIKENKQKLNALNFLIIVLGEAPKLHLKRACFGLSTLSLKAQPESNSYHLRPPQNIQIIKITQENQRKSNT